jgi:4a-hydroxytetrahydrobiopterin dehydratase
MATLSSTEISLALESLPGWLLHDGEIQQTFEFTDFLEAMSFVNSVAALAEQAGHHPDIDIRYNKVKLALVSHDSGGITAKDTALAAKINGIL